jgi:small basic protein
MLLPVLALALGFLIGYLTKFSVPAALATYMSVALLAALDSVFGGIKALLENKFDSLIFLTGFFFNTLLAGVLAFLGTSWVSTCIWPPSLSSVYAYSRT